MFSVRVMLLAANWICLVSFHTPRYPLSNKGLLYPWSSFDGIFMILLKVTIFSGKDLVNDMTEEMVDLAS
jgi:hypothetical protein